jgi:nucleotide-binding universal stress UspA family protein
MCPPVLVPLDGSARSECALAALDRFALDPEAVILLPVVPPVASPGPGGIPEADHLPHAPLQARSYLLPVRERVVAWYPRCLVRVEEGGSRIQILAAAKRHGRGLIAMTMPAGGLPGAISRGSLARWVAGATPTPILLVPSGAMSHAAIPSTRVIVPLDGSASAEEALPIATEIADRLRAELALVEAVDDTLSVPQVGGRMLPEVQERVRSGLHDRALHYLRRVAEDRMRPGRFVTWSVLERPQAPAIARQAGAADLVAAATPVRQWTRFRCSTSLVERVAEESDALLLRPAMTSLRRMP